jgi:secreted PhoX family phosphatase
MWPAPQGSRNSDHGRALTRLFYQAPTERRSAARASRQTGERLAIQHPGEDPGSTFESPSTRWPDFVEGTPPRPAVVAIAKRRAA